MRHRLARYSADATIAVLGALVVGIGIAHGWVRYMRHGE